MPPVHAPPDPASRRRGRCSLPRRTPDLGRESTRPASAAPVGGVLHALWGIAPRSLPRRAPVQGGGATAATSHVCCPAGEQPGPKTEGLTRRRGGAERERRENRRR